jgi:hypothetical protein
VNAREALNTDNTMRTQAVPSARRGVILLVVISLLVLFAAAGLCFVVYAESQATTARIWREAEDLQQPDGDPELLLSYFLNQLIYDTDNPHSALRGHSLARTMYGRPGGTTPYNGTGRLHTPGPQDNYYRINYQFGRDPDQDPGSPNAPYTYPDYNSLFLAAVQAADGRILVPSYHRLDPNGFGTLAPTNPNWTNPQGREWTLRPRPIDHSPDFPYPEDAGGDVKNLADSPGFFDPVTQSWCANDSIWIDLGFPVQTARDGRRFKPLFAPLIQDLDNRVNVNAHGFWQCYPARGLGWDANVFTSHQGWGPWEVNLQRVIGAQEPNGMLEARNLFRGKDGVPGRYDPNGFWGKDPAWLLACDPTRNCFAPCGPFYSMVNYDCYPTTRNAFQLPPANSGVAFPFFKDDYANGTKPWIELLSHPRNYNPFNPSLNSWSSHGSISQHDRAFGVSNMEALLRYGDTGSPALTCELFQLCRLSFADAKVRRLVTTHSADLLRPGAAPFIWDAPGSAPYKLDAGLNYPVGDKLPSPPTGTVPGGEFGPDGGSLFGALGRIELNRMLFWAPVPAWPAWPGPTLDVNSGYFKVSRQHRQDMAQEIFDVLRKVTGAALVDPVENDPAAQDPTKPEYDALRWLAQLAINIVCYVDGYPFGYSFAATVDYLAPFNWNPKFKSDVDNGWVFGTQLPRLLINEVYAEMVNDPSDTASATKNYQVKFWVELHNPMCNWSNAKPNGPLPNLPANPWAALPLTDNGLARLQSPPDKNQNHYPMYQLVIAKHTAANDAYLRKPGNVLGNLDPTENDDILKTTVDDYTADTPSTNQPLMLAGEELCQVWPARCDNGNGPKDWSKGCAAGENKGYFVLGPKDPLPGTDELPNFFASLPVRANEQDKAGGPKHRGMTYELSKDTDFTKNPIPDHTVLLRRLANPYVPPQPDPMQPAFNPYVTVDYVTRVKTNDGRKYDRTGKLNQGQRVTAVTDRASQGRLQPYAAHSSQQAAQQPAKPTPGQPKHTFFAINEPRTDPFDWLVLLNRQIISTMELLQVPATKPHELTQRFMSRDNNGNLVKFDHRAPWFDEKARIYRALEFLEGGNRYQWSPIGGRTVGRINLNTVWDIETFQALCDRQDINFFTDAAVANIFRRMLQSRTPGGIPGVGADRPFRGLATPVVPPGDAQYPLGSGIDDTFLRAHPQDPNRHLFEPDPNFNNNELQPEARDHPYLKDELMTKIFTNTTTRSNVFAVWLTVGFFEVKDEPPARPPRLGTEIGRAEGRHIRHRMFAIVDRSNLTVQTDHYTGKSAPGPRPYFLESCLKCHNDKCTVGTTSTGSYEGVAWKIKPGDSLSLDVGVRQEWATVSVANGTAVDFLNQACKPHRPGFAVSNAVLGNPGPQPRWDMRQWNATNIVRYFSLID